MKRAPKIVIALACLAMAAPAKGFIIVGTDFEGRTFSGNVVTVADYTLSGIANPGNLTFVGPSAFMTSSDATDKAIPFSNPPNWSVLIPLNVGALAIEMSNVTVSFEAFNNAQESKTNVSGGFSPNYQPTVRLLNSGLVEIDSETQDAYAVNGNTSVAAWTAVFNFVDGETLAADTNYFIEISMTGSSGNNVGIDSFTINAIPEPGIAMLGGIGLLGLLRRRR